MSNSRMKKLISISLCFLVSSALVSTAFAKVNLSGWDLVDSGKHLDYDGDSKYMDYVDIGVGIWNAYKPGVIREDTLLTLEDVFITDVNIAGGATGVTFPEGRIELCTYYLDNCTDAQITNTVTHEIGHALGLGHSDSDTEIMYFQQTSRTTLSQNDKDSYDAAYKTY